MIRRCDRILRGYEEKLHLVERFLKIRGKVEEIQERAEEPETVRALSREILEEL